MKIILSTPVVYIGIVTEFFRDSLESYSTLKNSILNAKDKLNHHVPIMFTFKISYKRRELTQQTSSFYLYDKANWKKFEEEVYDALEKIKDNDITILSNKIHESIRKSAMRNIPKKNGLQKSPSLPKHILDLIKCRKNLQKKYNKSRSLFDKENLYSIVDTIENEIKKYKSDLWNKFIDKMQQKNRYILGTIPFWKRINNLRKQKTKKGMATLINEGKRIECDFEKAELFGNRLEQIFSEDNNPRYDNNHRDKVNKYLNLKKYEEEYTQNEKVTKFITEKELKIAIKNLNKKNSIDSEGLSNIMLKKIGSNGQKKILELFNTCLENYSIPKSLKFSNITMIPKKSNDPENPKNYRPISLTPCLARLLERILLKRLNLYLHTKNIIIPEQSGFRNHRQTKDNICYLTQKVQENINLGKNTIGLFFDISSAFDKVWHQGLILKLISIKVPYYLVKIIMAFLNERTFKVLVGEKTSSLKKISAGVPQGGVLSPTLFSIFINDIPLATETKTSFSLLFADDLVTAFNYKDRMDAQLQAQKYLKLLAKWGNKWRLSFAPNKSNILVFTKKRSPDLFNLLLYDEVIPQVNETKFLGIIFDPRLDFKNHINQIIESCSDRLKVVRTLASKAWGLEPSIVMSINKLLVRSLMEYSSLICTTINPKLINQLQIIQNNALRAILKKKKQIIYQLIDSIRKQKFHT